MKRNSQHPIYMAAVQQNCRKEKVIEMMKNKKKQKQPRGSWMKHRKMLAWDKSFLHIKVLCIEINRICDKSLFCFVRFYTLNVEFSHRFFVYSQEWDCRIAILMSLYRENQYQMGLVLTIFYLAIVFHCENERKSRGKMSCVEFIWCCQNNW